MSNREVAGLQALAKKHGGSLTTNPDTGLPEAGFLDSLLPTIAGGALTYFSGGAITPMMSAGIVGGISALDSKDLGKGLMAGLGAYGGGSMVGGLAGMGLGEGVSATATAPAQEAAMQAAKGEAYQNAVGKGASNFGSMFASKPMDAITSFGGGSGLNAGRTLFAAAAPAIMADQNVKTTTPAPERGKIRPYTFNAQQMNPSQTGPVSGERRYFNNEYTAGDPYAAANGGLVALARGGYAQQPLFRPTAPLPANNMYGASRDAYDYLMGVNPTGGQSYDPNRPFPPMLRGEIPENGMQPDPSKPKKGHYEFDPVTGQYRFIPDPVAPVDIAPPVFENPAQRGGGGGGGMDSESREARQKEINERMDAWEKSDPEGYAKRNDFIGETLGTVGKFLVPGGFLNMFTGGIPLGDTSPLPVDQEGHVIQNPLGQNPSAVSEGTTGEIEAANAKAYEGYSPPQGDPAQRKLGLPPTPTATNGIASLAPAFGTTTPTNDQDAGESDAKAMAAETQSLLNRYTVPAETTTVPTVGFFNSMLGQPTQLAAGVGFNPFANTTESTTETAPATNPMSVDPAQAGIAALAQAQAQADAQAAQAQAAANPMSIDPAQAGIATLTQTGETAQQKQDRENFESAQNWQREQTASDARQAAAQAQADREQAGREAARQAEAQAQAQAQAQADREQAGREDARRAETPAPAPAPAPAPPSNDNYSNEGRNSTPPAPAPPSNDNYSNEGRNSEGGGGGGGGGGGRVICTHFYRKGEMSREMWRSDLEFTFKNLSPTTVRGYQYWAIPYVKLMRKSKLAENIMRPLAMHRAQELSYQMGRSPKGSFFGKLVRLVGEPICFTVGLFVGEQNWQSLWNPAKD
jgi:hypothetical protein